MIRPLFGALLVAALLCGCGDGKKPQTEKEDTAYKVINDQHYSTAKRSVDVVLDERLKKGDLRRIATEIKNGDKENYDRTVVGYYIASEDRSNGYWATATFDPDLKINVLGVSRERIDAVKKADQPGSNSKIVGAWLDDRPHVRATLELIKQGDGLALKSVNAEGTTSVTPMDESKKNGNVVLRDPENPDAGRYFVINENGQLEFWGPDGRYYTASSL